MSLMTLEFGGLILSSSRTDTPGSSVETVMIVEDEPIVAQDIIFILEDAGFQCCGPYRSVAAALDGIDRCTPDFALLDVNLCDGQVFPVADALVERGVGFAFCSAHYGQEEGAADYADVRVIPKPFFGPEIVDAVMTQKDVGAGA